MLTLAFVISVLVLVSAAYRRSTERLEAAWPFLSLVEVCLIYAMIVATALSGLQYIWKAALLVRRID